MSAPNHVFDHVQQALARELLPVIEHTVLHAGRNVVLKNFASGFRVACGLPSSPSLMRVSRVNTRYANAHGAVHGGGHQFISTIRIPLQRLDEIADEVRTLADSVIGISSSIDDTADKAAAYFVENATVVGKVPIITAEDEDIFEALWALGIPMIVDVSDDIYPGLWTPEVFVHNHERETVRIIKQSHSGVQEISGTLQEFMCLFQMSEEERGYVVKLKDYPPSEAFQDLYYDHYEAFQRCLPFPSHTSASGFYNLVAHFPVARDKKAKSKVPAFSCVKPDIGPKMYLATMDQLILTDTMPSPKDAPARSAPSARQHPLGSSVGGSPDEPIFDNLADIQEYAAATERRQGSTKLHMDMSGAVNIMVADLSGKGSLWTIFAAKDTEAIRRYLRKKYNLGPSSPCPIHAQHYYLQPADLRALLAEESVMPYIFTQTKGQAVFIPVGCAHQVSNNGACIKIATDFVSLSQISINRQLAKEFHHEGIEDVLGLEAVLWHAWQSVKEQQVISEGVDEGKARDHILPSLPIKRVPHHPNDTARARKKARRCKKKHRNDDASQKAYPCPDPSCASHIIDDRRYSWATLHQHIMTAHHRKLPPLGTWKLYEHRSNAEWKAWYTRRIRKQALEEAFEANL
ncbi:hypothetical protein EIP86_001882 [Pleurotus ostreatoroseus]|nr:hypothetical protein EIP86_001882 [Pleurotus ostreatoroseus]